MTKQIKYFLKNNSIWSNILASYANSILSFLYNSIILIYLVPHQWGIISGILVFKDLALNFNLGESEFIRKNFYKNKNLNVLKITASISIITVIFYFTIFHFLFYLNYWKVSYNIIFYLCIIFLFDYINYTPTNIAKSLGRFNLLKITYLSIPLLNLFCIPLIILYGIDGFFISKIISSITSVFILLYYIRKELLNETFSNSKKIKWQELIRSAYILQLVNVVIFFINAIPRFVIHKADSPKELGFFAFGVMLMAPFNQYFLISNDYFFQKLNLLGKDVKINIWDDFAKFLPNISIIFCLYPIGFLVINKYFFQNYHRELSYYINIAGSFYIQAISLRLINIIIVQSDIKKMLFLLKILIVIIFFEFTVFLNWYNYEYNSAFFFLISNLVILIVILFYYYIVFSKDFILIKRLLLLILVFLIIILIPNYFLNNTFIILLFSSLIIVIFYFKKKSLV